MSNIQLLNYPSYDCYEIRNKMMAFEILTDQLQISQHEKW